MILPRIYIFKEPHHCNPLPSFSTKLSTNSYSLVKRSEADRTELRMAQDSWARDVNNNEGKMCDSGDILRFITN